MESSSVVKGLEAMRWKAILSHIFSRIVGIRTFGQAAGYEFSPSAVKWRGGPREKHCSCWLDHEVD